MAAALKSLEKEPIYSPLARSVWFIGGLFTYHAESADTNGRFALIEISGVPGAEPPKHVHRNEDELFFVLEGKLKVFRGDDELTLNPGDAGYLPRNVPHTFQILSKHARWLNYITPGGFEEYFREMGQPADKFTAKEVSERPDIPKMIRVAAKYGITFVQESSR